MSYRDTGFPGLGRAIAEMSRSLDAAERRQRWPGATQSNVVEGPTPFFIELGSASPPLTPLYPSTHTDVATITVGAGRWLFLGGGIAAASAYALVFTMVIAINGDYDTPASRIQEGRGNSGVPPGFIPRFEASLGLDCSVTITEQAVVTLGLGAVGDIDPGTTPPDPQAAQAFIIGVPI